MTDYLPRLHQYQAAELAGFTVPICVLVLLVYRIYRQSTPSTKLDDVHEWTTAYEVSESLPEPDPVINLDLSTRTTRNYLYVNKASIN